jgi:hypothetical protein
MAHRVVRSSLSNSRFANGALHCALHCALYRRLMDVMRAFPHCAVTMREYQPHFISTEDGRKSRRR